MEASLFDELSTKQSKLLFAVNSIIVFEYKVYRNFGRELLESNIGGFWIEITLTNYSKKFKIKNNNQIEFIQI